MNKKNLLLNSGIVIVVISIILLILFKFILNDKINIGIDINQIKIYNINGDKIQLSDIIPKDGITYCFVFDMNDCNTCILKGIDDLIELKKSGLDCFALAIHHRIDEVSGWSSNYDFTPFFMINKKVFMRTLKYSQLQL